MTTATKKTKKRNLLRCRLKLLQLTIHEFVNFLPIFHFVLFENRSFVKLMSIKMIVNNNTTAERKKLCICRAPTRPQQTNNGEICLDFSVCGLFVIFLAYFIIYLPVYVGHQSVWSYVNHPHQC